MQSGHDLIVVGAGLVGLATAYFAQKAGAKVLVLDRGATAYEASSRATGFLSLRGETPEESPLALIAEKLWPTLDEELGYPTEWKQKGRIWVAINELEAEKLKHTWASFETTDIGFELIDGKRCREIVPAFTEDVIAGIYTPRSGHANTQRTSQAFAWAFQDLGGVIMEHTPVLSVIERSGKVAGVRTAGGDLHADKVVLAAGANNVALLDPFGVVYPTAPVRLEAMITTPLPPLFECCMIGHGISVRQTRRGNLQLNGGPHEWIDTDLEREPEKPTTPIVRNMVRRVLELLPIAKQAQLLRTWGGVVDITPDQMTIIHRFDTPSGLVVASAGGHGFGMAPSLGQALSELALHGATNAPISRLTLDRFKNLPRDWRLRKKWHAGSYNT
ncbi:MAG: FAD-binding oxidoreductase [Hyphomicrobiaceae bacterium]